MEPFDACIDNNGTYTKYSCNESTITIGTYPDATCDSVLTEATQISDDMCKNSVITACTTTGKGESCVVGAQNYVVVFAFRTSSVCWFGWQCGDEHCVENLSLHMYVRQVGPFVQVPYTFGSAQQTFMFI